MMIQGLRTAVYHVSDMARAKAWYSAVLEVAPYFDEPFYIGFNVGGFELGLHPMEGDAKSGPGGVVTYWGVADAAAGLKRLLALGASKHTDVTDVGGGIKIAAVLDPFGNIFGIIENPHFSLT
jgi:predicted enzyme related to lactoylglutathione lyase